MLRTAVNSDFICSIDGMLCNLFGRVRDCSCQVSLVHDSSLQSNMKVWRLHPQRELYAISLRQLARIIFAGAGECFRFGEDLGSGFCVEIHLLQCRTAPLAQCRSSSYMSCCDFGVPVTRGLLAFSGFQHGSYLQEHDCVRWCHHLCLVRSCRRVGRL